jgi:hypothetical protein
LPRTPVSSSREVVPVFAVPQPAPRSGSSTPVCCGGPPPMSRPAVAVAVRPPSPRPRPWAYAAASAPAAAPTTSSGKWQHQSGHYSPQPASPNAGQQRMGSPASRAFVEDDPRDVRRLVSAIERRGPAEPPSTSGLFRFASTGARGGIGSGDAGGRSMSSNGRIGSGSSRSGSVSREKPTFTAVAVAAAVPSRRAAVSASPSVLHRSTSHQAASYIPVAAPSRIQAPLQASSPVVGCSARMPSVTVRDRIRQIDLSGNARW